MGHRDKTFATAGERLIDELNCLSCHKIEGYSAGPSYTKVAERYPTDSPANVNYLASKIINGGNGVWGEKAMPAHPNLSEDDAKTIVNFILSINNPPSQNGLEPTGNYVLNDHIDTKKEGRYVLKSSYLDEGGEFVGPLKASNQLYLRYYKIKATSSDLKDKAEKIELDTEIYPSAKYKDRAVEISSGGQIGFNQIDLTEIKAVNIEFYTKNNEKPEGTFELKANGKVIGNTNIVDYSQNGTGGYSLQIPIEEFEDFTLFTLTYQHSDWNKSMTVHRLDFLPKETSLQLSMK